MTLRAGPIALLTLLPTLLLPGVAAADSPDVLKALAQCRPDPKKDQSLCRFAITIRHADDGWKHYTRHFQFLKPNGEVFVTRFLKQPHQKQPFTRTITKVPIPYDIEWLEVRAGDLVHERGQTQRVEIPHVHRPEAQGDEAAGATTGKPQPSEP